MPKLNVLQKVNRKINIHWLSHPNLVHQQIHFSYIKYLLSFVGRETPLKPDDIVIKITIVVAAVVEVGTPRENKCICILTVHIKYCKRIKYSIITVILA